MVKKKLECYKCQYFKVIHTTQHYACKALGFKSKTKNWTWLVLPCPYFKENPLRLKTKKKSVKKGNSSKTTKNPKNNLDLLI